MMCDFMRSMNYLAESFRCVTEFTLKGLSSSLKGALALPGVLLPLGMKSRVKLPANGSIDLVARRYSLSVEGFDLSLYICK